MKEEYKRRITYIFFSQHAYNVHDQKEVTPILYKQIDIALGCGISQDELIIYFLECSLDHEILQTPEMDNTLRRILYSEDRTQFEKVQQIINYLNTKDYVKS